MPRFGVYLQLEIAETAKVDEVGNAILVLSICFYVVVYFLTKFAARIALKQDGFAIRPRLIALCAVILSACCLATWARFNLVDQKALNSLPPFEAGNYIGAVIAPFVVSAIISSVFILFRIWRTSRKNKRMQRDERRQNRKEPTW